MTYQLVMGVVALDATTLLGVYEPGEFRRSSTLPNSAACRIVGNQGARI